MTDFFESRIENLEHKEEKKKSSAAGKKSKDKKSHKKVRIFCGAQTCLKVLHPSWKMQPINRQAQGFKCNSK